MPELQNIALIGASGTIGRPILSALRAHPTFIPYVLNRQSSKSIYPRTRVITIPDDLSVSEIAASLREHSIHALIIAIAGSHVSEQKRLIDAALESGCVRRVIPAEFGSCDSADDETNSVLPLMKGKSEVRGYVEGVCEKSRGRLSWSSVVTGHFFDWGLGNGFLKYDVKSKKAWIVDGGDVRFSTSTLGFVADAVVRVLEREEGTRNRMLYVQGLYVTQNEVLRELERVTGGKWEVVEQRSEKELEVLRPRMLEGDMEAREEVVAIWGIIRGDWTKKEGFANELLGLKEEDLRSVVEEVVKSQA
ncbi:NAD(P)-binding protein [Sporormia fimetaria CBS 119925]|uniref:NAD(P)-binding protein n=1 Tax=Sporormia fimetaria CBS 119925 TaxID=1340428 RepID=A0A6A6UZG9_9PLEO|nr:NAD(P)-binding protein [Sporormia fimetaria CBS 119925]